MNDASSVRLKEMSTVNAKLQVSANTRHGPSVSDMTTKVPDLDKLAELSDGSVDVSPEPDPSRM